MTKEDGETFRSTRHQREVVLADWRDAEELARWHMRTVLKFTDADLTPNGPDGGIDVRSRLAVAQVKHYGGAVSAPEVQQLKGAGYGVENALFYALSGYTRGALSAAESSSVALFAYTVYGDVSTLNGHSLKLLSTRASVHGAECSTCQNADLFEGTEYSTVLARLRLDIERSVVRGELPPSYEEGFLITEFMRLQGEHFENILDEVRALLDRFDYFATGISGNMEWYRSSGGPQGLPSFFGRLQAQADEVWALMDQAHPRTRAELLAIVDEGTRRLDELSASWVTYRDGLDFG